ncbi:SDR family oxidoreductase [Devosia sp.]|uniref:SDR family oxidoreductase n=1 Tax=Devosia sp. TaxID=1871048 RepID=UPI003BAC210F
MLRDKKVVVLGGSRGIGLAVAELAAAEGAKLVVVASQAASVATAVARLPSGTAGFTVDLRSPDSIGKLFADIGPFDHLVYTAGEPIPFGPHVAELDLAAARGYFDVRFWGVLQAVQAAKPFILPGGSIVLTGGTSARRPPAGFAIGASISGAVESLGRALAIELAPLRVNVVVPGMVTTELWSAIPPAAREQMFADVGSRLPVGRVGTPADLAEAYVSLLRSDYTTGQSVVVDGGATLV